MEYSAYRCPNCLVEFPLDDSPDNTVTICPACQEDISSPIHTFMPGKVLGDYHIVELLGLGGMGEVFLAEQMSMGHRKVALKILLPELASDKGYMHRFAREVTTLASIEHPNVVQAIETGFEGDVNYLAMMYIKGEDIKDALNRGKVYGELEGLKIIHKVALALKSVWEHHKVIHRDVKPDNIMISEDKQVLLMDLGISKRVTEDSELTVAGMMVGSPNYVSPEQARAEKEVDFRADIYSLGSTYYHMITGEPPYSAENPMGIITRHITDPIPNPQKVNSEISDKSVALIKLMMAKNPDDRFSSWGEVVEMIEYLINRLSPTSTGSSMIPQVEEVVKPEVVIKKKESNSLFALNWHRITALLLLLVLFLIAFSAVIMKSLDEAKRNRVRRHYDTALTFIEKGDNKSLLRAFKKLEQVQRMGDETYFDLAKAKIKEVENIMSEKEEQRKIKAMQRELESVKKQARQFEKKRDYKNAILVWKRYKVEGKYKDEREFVLDCRQSLLYLNEKLCQQEEGLLE